MQPGGRAGHPGRHLGGPSDPPGHRGLVGGPNLGARCPRAPLSPGPLPEARDWSIPAAGVRAGTRVLCSPQLLSTWPAPQMAPSARAHARRCVRADSPADTRAGPAPAGPTSLPLGASRAPGPLPARFSRHREPHTSLRSRTGWKALALGFALSLPGRGRGWHRRAAGRQLRLPIRTPHAARRPGACTAPRPGCVHSAGARHQGRFENISCRL